MGIKSTYLIERVIAKNIIIAIIASLTNEEIADMLLVLKESYARNYIVKEKLSNEDILNNELIINNIADFTEK